MLKQCSIVKLSIASAILRVVANINHSIQGAAAPFGAATALWCTAVICGHAIWSTVFWVLVSNLERSKMVLVSMWPCSITLVHIVPAWYTNIHMQASKHIIAVNLHESNITDCAIAPPVTILVPRRAPIYYDGSISSVACKCLNDRSLGSRTNNVGTASPLTLITRSGSRCCVYTFMHSDYCCLMRTWSLQHVAFR